MRVMVLAHSGGIGRRIILRAAAPGERPRHGRPMHVAHFIHRYPPALGGAEAYFARLGCYLAERGDTVTVWTTTAVDLRAFWQRGFAEIATSEDPAIRRYPPKRWPG